MTNFEARQAEAIPEKLNSEMVNEAEHTIEVAISSQEELETIVSRIQESSSESPELQPLVERAEALRIKSHGLTGRFTDAVGWIARVAAVSGALVTTGDFNAKQKMEDINVRIQRAQMEIAERGIPSEQEKAHIPVVGEFLQRNIRPWSYDPMQTISEIPKNILEGRQAVDAVSEDAWRLYLGLPQQGHSFGVTKYKPTRSKEDIFYYSINNPVDHFVGVYEYTSASEMIHSIMFRMHDGRLPSVDNGPLGNFTWSSGSDEHGTYIAYYDRWDLGYTTEGKNGLLGKPFEIYDRIYYDKDTFEPISK